MTSCKCPTAPGGRGTSTTVAVMSAPRISLSSSRKPCAWSSLSTSGICLLPPPLPLRPGDMRLTGLQDHQEVLCHGNGLHRFCPHPPLLLPHTRLTRPPRLHLRALARPRHPARAMGVHPRGKHLAVLPQTHNPKEQGTDWGPNPAPWVWELVRTDETGPQVQQKQAAPNSSW